jgi:hypothetical protein
MSETAAIQRFDRSVYRSSVPHLGFSFLPVTQNHCGTVNMVPEVFVYTKGNVFGQAKQSGIGSLIFKEKCCEIKKSHWGSGIG